MKVDVSLTRFQKVLYHLAKFVGLSPFTVTNGEIRPVTFLGKAYALTLIALTLSYAWCYNRNVSYSTDTNSSINLIIVIVFLVFEASTVSALYIFSFKSDKMIEVIRRIGAAEEELETLGAERRRRGSLKIIASNVFVLTIEMTELANLPSTPRLAVTWYIMFWIGSVLLFLHNINVILIFAHAMNRIESCFESLNKKLWDVPNPSRASPISVLVGRLTTGEDPTEVRLSAEGVGRMRKLHHELSSLVESTTDLFAIPIVLNIFYLFSCSLIHCYTFYSSVPSLESLLTGADGPILRSLLLTLLPAAMVVVLKLLLIAHACSSTCDAGNVTKVEIHRVWNEFHPEELRDELFMFSVQLLHNPVAATAFGFFDLGYSHVQQIFCAVVAYSVVMIQLDTPPPRNTSARE